MKSLYTRYAALYNFSYMSIGSLLPLIGQYMKYIGFSGAQIGTIMSTGTAVAIFASTFWGREYNRSDRKHEILIFLCVMASLMCFVLMNAKTYYLFLIVFGIMYFFQSPIMSLTDAFTVASEHNFGGLRAWGAVGFALGIFLAGNAVDIFELDIIFIFYIISFALAAIMVGAIKRNRTGLQMTHKSRSEKKIDMKDDSSSKINMKDNISNEESISGYREILHNKWIRRIIICAFFMGGTNVANNTYFSFLYIEGGGTVAGVGIVMLLMVGSEVPFMMWCERLSSKFTMQRMILMAMIISVTRFLIFGAGLPWWMLGILSFSQGAVNGILLIEFVRYVSKSAPKGNESLAISAYYIVGSNLSTICCQLAGGILLDIAGAKGVYLFFGAFNLIGVILYIGFGLYRSGENDI